VQDLNGDPYTCGFVRLTYEENSTSAKGFHGQSDTVIIRVLNSQGNNRFTFGEIVSVTVKMYQILDYLFEEVYKNESNILVSAGELVEENISLVQCENVDVYWERLNFSRSFDLTGKRILTIVGNDYDVLESRMIIEYLAYFGADVTVASNRLDVTSHYWLRSVGGFQSYTGPDSVSTLLQNVNFDDFDCLFCPGGNGPANLLSEYPDITSRILNTTITSNLFYSAICHGPLLLAESDIINGKQITGHFDIESSVTSHGGIFVPGEPVLVDGNIQTGNWPYFRQFSESMAAILENW
jgi:protease I